MEQSSAFGNRLRKNFRHFRKWAGRQGLTAFRIYDRDLPEYPCSIDWYEGRVHLIEYPRTSSLARCTARQQSDEVAQTICKVLEVDLRHLYAKQHRPKAWGREQYQPTGDPGEWFTVSEQGLKFWVNLGAHLDTGLFLDHRRTRARVRDEAAGKSFLNLFSYTGSFTVYAAAGGAERTTSVDLSKRYLDWAARNLTLNHFERTRCTFNPGNRGQMYNKEPHELIRADASEWLADARRQGRKYDLIVIDPPPFSLSKSMRRSFNVQRDHVRLVEGGLALLAPGGSLYFSTSFQAFEPQWQPAPGVRVEEITPASIPEDFQRKQVHRCWRLTLGGQGTRPTTVTQSRRAR